LKNMMLVRPACKQKKERVMKPGETRRYEKNVKTAEGLVKNDERKERTDGKRKGIVV